jgi:hypothetical protein
VILRKDNAETQRARSYAEKNTGLKPVLLVADLKFGHYTRKKAA